MKELTNPLVNSAKTIIKPIPMYLYFSGKLFRPIFLNVQGKNIVKFGSFEEATQYYYG